MVKGVLLVSLLAVVSASPNLRERFQDTDGTWELLGAKGYSGNIVMNELTGSSYFYWLFEKIASDISQDKAPMIIFVPWSPEGSAEVEMLWEPISPIKVHEGHPDPNDGTWAMNFHLLSIDFPLGAGYSYAAEASDIGNSSMAATEQVYSLLQKLAKKYPSWFDRDLYLYGEYFGGGWALEVAYHILKNNAKTGVINLPLKGLMMANPMIDPLGQTQKYSGYGYNLGYFNIDERGIIEGYEAKVKSDIESQNWLSAHSNFEEILNLYDQYTTRNRGNIRQSGSYDFAKINRWLELASTKQLLHVPSSITWTLGNSNTTSAFKPETMKSKVDLIPYIMENTRVLICSSQFNFLTPLTGVQEMIANSTWEKAQDFIGSKKLFWKVNGKMAGYAQSHDNLTFVLLLKAGLFPGLEQPSNMKVMVYKFINGEAF